MNRIGLAIAIATLTLSGCAERSGCPTTSLVEIGNAEGKAGLAATLPNAQCELSETERDSYYAARNSGLVSYCAASDAFVKGLAGETLDPEVCPLDLRTQFRSAWRAGTEIAKLEQRRSENLKEAQTLQLTADGVEGDARQALLDQVNARRQDARQDQNDLEALRGLATVEGWQPPPATPEPEADSAND